MSTATQTSSRDLMASIRRVFSSRDSHMTLILILAIAVATILIPRFSQPRTLTFLTLDVTATLLMALPMTLVMINADIDLSVASTAGLVSASFGVLVQSGVGFSSFSSGSCCTRPRTVEASSRSVTPGRPPSSSALTRSVLALSP